MKFIKANKISKEWLIILSLVVLKLVIHFATNTNYELHRDALLYYSLGDNLAWGYTSVPPLIALISKFSTVLFGNTVFALRFFPAIIGGLSVLVIAKIIKEFNGSILAIVIASLAFILSPAFLRTNTLFQPVAFNQFFWLLSGYLIVKLIHTSNTKVWYLIFIVWGIAFLNKYSITFFILSFLIGILFTPQRNLLKSKHFFLGGIIGMLIILPNILWQFSNNWPLLHHMSELQKNQLVNVSLLGFVIDQIVMNFPGLIIWITGLLVFLFFKAEKKYRVLAYIYLLTVLTIILLRGKSYYTLGLYPILFAMGGYAVDTYFKNYFKYVVIAFILVASIPMLPLSLPIYSYEKLEEYITENNLAEFTNRWEDGEIHNLPQDYADMTGWKELSSIVINHFNSLPTDEKNSCIIYAGNYGQAGSIKFYGEKYGLPEPISFSDNFLLWAPDTINNELMLFIDHDIGDIEFLYDSYEEIGQVNNKYFRENGLKVFYCTEPKDTFNIFYANKVKELKNIYH